jgi:hypothetical protein
MGSLQSYFGGINNVTAAYQDRIAFTVENAGHRFMLKATQAFINKFIERWEAFYYDGVWDVGHGDYTRGQVVTSNEQKYICITASGSGSYQPGVTSDWENYWALGVWRPDWFGEMKEYYRLGYELWECNGSAFELILKLIEDDEDVEDEDEAEENKSDWWWDDSTPRMYNDKIKSTWSYDYAPLRDLWEEYWDLATGGAPDQYHPEWYPQPDGCWRRTWRYSLGKVFGKVMWPAELGDPREYFNLEKGDMIVSQSKYDNIFYDRTRVYYQVKDVPDMLRRVEAKLDEVVDVDANPTRTYRDIIEERHGPVQQQHVIEEGSSTITIDEYELKAQMFNHMHKALSHLKWRAIDDTVSVHQWGKCRGAYAVGERTGDRFNSPIDAVQYGNNKAENHPGVTGYIIRQPGGGTNRWIYTGYKTGSLRQFPGSPPEYVNWIDNETQYQGLIDESSLKSRGVWIVGDASGGSMDADGSHLGKWKLQYGSIGDDWQIGDFITISAHAYTSANVYWTNIVALLDEDGDGIYDHFTVNITYDAGIHTGTWYVYRWSSWTRGANKIKLRIWYRKGDYQCSIKERCRIGILGELLYPHELVSRKKIGYLTCGRNSLTEPTIFEASIYDPWPAHAPSDSLYNELSEAGGGDAERLTDCMFKDTAPDGWTLDDHIIVEIDWERYVNEAEFDIFELKCDNVVEVNWPIS